MAIENTDYAYLDAGSTNIQNGGSGTKYGLLSFFGKVDYVFDNKYLASANVRRDGSSRFGKRNQYGTFPGFSLGYRVSQEDFFRNKISFISDLKLRYSYGVNGNQEIANNATYTLYQSVFGTDRTWNPDQGTAYDISGSNSGAIPSGYVRTQFGNDSLKWETTKQSNFSVDFGILDNKITGSIDYFIKKTTGILIVPPLLGVVGGGTPPWLNGASMQNTGIEVLLSYSGKINKDIKFNVSGNIATYKNKVIDLPVNSLSAYPGNGTTKTILDRSINSFYGYVVDGLFTTADQVTNSSAQPGKGLGRIRYQDLNSDNIINDQDQTFLGNSDPKFTYGLNFALEYKKIDFSIFFQGVSGNKVYNSFKGQSDFSSLSAGANWGRRTLQAWTLQNPNSTIPAVTLIDQNTESRSSTYFLEAGSYLKLRNVQLGYTINTRSNYFKAIRFYFQGSNLLTFKSKSFTGADPEMPGFSYPIPSIYTLGFNASF